MLHFCRLYRYLSALSLVILGSMSNAAAMPRVVPLRTSVTFSPRSSVSQWSVPIRSDDGRTVYVLSLEPEFSMGKHLAALTLVLRHFGDKNDAPNLLDPRGIWHGIQPCDFVANDLAQGAQKSVFGDKRTISRKDLGLMLRIIVSNAMVSPLSAGNYQLDALDLQIEVNNSNP